MSIAAISADVIESHILAKLDGTTLASAAAASPMLRALYTEEKLWKDICTSTWSSINDSRISHVISTFPHGYRSFFSDSFSTATTVTSHRSPPHHDRELTTSELISAVDLRYNGKTIYSKVQLTETLTDDFLSSSLYIDVLRRKDTPPPPVPVNFGNDTNEFISDLEESMRLSWIIIDPTLKRAVNLSCEKPIAVERLYTPEGLQLLYVTVLPGNSRVGLSDPVKCMIEVTCRWEEGGEVHVSEVNLQVQDIDGINLSGKDALVVFQEAMGSKRSKRGKGKQLYEEFLEKKRERRHRNLTREKRLDMICTVIRVFIFLTILCGVICGY